MPLEPGDRMHRNDNSERLADRPRLERIGAKLGPMNWIALALIAGALLVGFFSHH